MERLPDILDRYAYQSICVVSDVNTEEAAGWLVYGLLSARGYPYHKIVFPDSELIPDERAVGALLTQTGFSCDLILAVGSGTINDLCRYVSCRLQIDYFVIATAPSMDGYASSVSPLIVNHLKTTYETHMPKVIVGDVGILKAAPMPMIAAGVGDILGKFVCLLDWKVSSLVCDEYFCPEIEKIVRQSIDKVLSRIDGVRGRNGKAIAAVMEGLILSGIAMNYSGNSRPASGSEHHLSHYWEMMNLLEGKEDALHGIKVGVGTVICISLYKKLRDIRPDFTRAEAYSFDIGSWKGSIKKAYGISAEGVIRLEEQTGKNSDAAVKSRLMTLNKKLPEIHSLIDALPDEEEIISILKKIGAPCRPAQIGVGKDTLTNSILYAKDLRNRYGLLQLLYDLQLAEGLSQTILLDD